MAVVNPTIKDISGDGSVFLVKWILPLAADTGAPIGMVEWGDRSIQAEGTFGGTAALQCSNDSTDGTDGTFVACNDTGGTAITWSATASIKQVLPVARFMHPINGSGCTAVTYTMIVRRSNTMRT